MDNNKIKVYTSSSGAELSISAPSTKQVISATNNRAQYFAEQAKKYRDEAKQHRDNAKYYADQNSDVTFEYINNIQAALESKIAGKQDIGNYALKDELPINVSELVNDSEYVNKEELNTTADSLKLPSQDGFDGRFLMTDGENPQWVGINTLQLFDTVIKDHILTYEESKGFALQGTYVYKDALAGSRYGYPDFYNKCVEEFNQATTTETINGVDVVVHSNGHRFYDIANKSAIDEFYDTCGIADFYGVDIENERIFLPRNKYFFQLTDDTSKVNEMIDAGLPNITGTTVVQCTNNTGDTIFTTSNGALNGTHESGWSNRLGSGTVKEQDRLTFDASRSNPIYGNSNTVQPPASLKLLYYVIGNTINYEGITDVVNQGMEILEQVNQGVQEIIPNNSELISNYAMPSNRNITLTIGANQTVYTAPANGYFVYKGEFLGRNNSTAQFDTSEGLITKLIGDGATVAGCGMFVPVKKGGTCKFGYWDITHFSLTFVYAEGGK